MAKLILTNGDKPREIPIQGPLTIGRQSGNTVRIDEPKASRTHARITLDGSEFRIEDLDSSNGTKVNGRKISQCALRHGDSIQIGGTRIVFDEDAGVALPKDGERKEKEEAKKKSLRVISEDTRDPLVGSMIGGYKIQSKLGHGGMGTVYRAYQVSMERTVAMKVLKTELATNKDFVKGFLQEARIAGKLTHPAIVQVHDVGEDKGVLYFSMELVDGESIWAMLKREGKIPVAKALDIAIGVCGALGHASGHGIVHQDVKPHNIMMDKNSNVKLADLGLATMASREKPAPGGKPTVLMGSPHYMSPEQSEKRKIDTRTDIYALGATLFQMLTGRVPFDGPTSLVILTKHITNERPDPRQYDVTIPAELATVVMDMMAIQMEKRPGDPKELAQKLKDIKAAYLREQDEAGKKKGQGRAVVKKRAELPAPPLPGKINIVRHEEPRVVVERPPKEPAERREDPAPPAARESLRVPAPAASSPLELVKTGLLFVAVVVGMIVAWNLLDPLKTQPPPRPVDNPAIPRPPPIGPVVSKTTTVVPDSPKKTTTRTPDEKTPATGAGADPAVLADLKKALEARDRALQSGNFSGARQVLMRFRDANPVGAAADMARQELRDTERVIGDTVSQMLKDADLAAIQKKYRNAVTFCTRVISADPNSTAAMQAQALMSRIDGEAEPRSKEVIAEAEKFLAAGKLDDAIRMVGEGLDQLGGTKWAEALSFRQLQLVFANKFLKSCERARQERAQQGLLTEVKAPGRDGKPTMGILREINGLAIKAELGAATFTHTFQKMSPDEVYLLIEALKMKDHLGMAHLFAVLKYDAQASQELERAMKSPEQAAEAARLEARFTGASNLHVYDFSKWQQQSDWDAPMGAWSTQNDQYVLESPEGGDTVLKKDAIGGPFASQNARIGFEFTPKLLNDGYFVAMEFGDDKRNITVLFSADGYKLQAQAEELASVKGAWTPQLNQPTRVEMRIKDQVVSIVVNGQAGEPLTSAGVAGVKGSIAFHIREATCALDNITLRNENK